MKVFIDTEFNEFNGELISMSLVSENEDDPVFYKVYPIQEEYGPWVQEHVVPYLHVHEETNFSLKKYFEKLSLDNDDPNIEIIADWPDDIRHLCSEMITGPGEMIGVPWINFTFTLERDRCEGPYKPVYEHNALSDAATNRANYLFNTNDEEE